MAWIILLVAGGCEVVWALSLKKSEGFTRLGPSVITVIFLVASMVLLGVALRKLPVGTAYTMWTGIGAIGSVVGGIVLFHESADAARLACVALILAGIVGLKLVTP